MRRAVIVLTFAGAVATLVGTVTADELKRLRVVRVLPGTPACPKTVASIAFENRLLQLGSDRVVERHCFQQVSQLDGMLRRLGETEPRVFVVWGSEAALAAKR